MSFVSLWTGVSGLNAAQKQMEVTANNVANTNTPGYTRQRVELTPARPATGVFGSAGAQQSAGVTVADVVRLRNTIIDGSWRSAAADAGAWEARSNLLTRAQSILGPMDEGVSSALSEFWAAWDELALSPQDGAARSAVIASGEALARQLRSGAAEIDRVIAEAAVGVQEEVVEINRLANQVAQLNQRIAEAEAGNQSANDLLDQRDQVVDQLARLTGVTSRPNPSGNATIDLYLGSRVLVRGGKADAIQAATGGLAIEWAHDGAPVAIGGKTGAWLETANQTLPSLKGDLDAIALQLRDAVNAAHTAGFDRNGAPGLAFFTGTGASNIAVAALTVDQVAASAGGLPTDGNNALAIANVRTVTNGSGLTIAASVQALAGRLGTLAAGAETQASISEQALAHLDGERAETNSVSLDEEMANLVRFQRAYEAAARVISVVDEALEILINRTGV